MTKHVIIFNILFVGHLALFGGSVFATKTLRERNKNLKIAVVFLRFGSCPTVMQLRVFLFQSLLKAVMMMMTAVDHFRNEWIKFLVRGIPQFSKFFDVVDVHRWTQEGNCLPSDEVRRRNGSSFSTKERMKGILFLLVDKQTTTEFLSHVFLCCCDFCRKSERFLELLILLLCLKKERDSKTWREMWSQEKRMTAGQEDIRTRLFLWLNNLKGSLLCCLQNRNALNSWEDEWRDLWKYRDEKTRCNLLEV
jgi:hypothetical protein